MLVIIVIVWQILVVALIFVVINMEVMPFSFFVVLSLFSTFFSLHLFFVIDALKCYAHLYFVEIHPIKNDIPFPVFALFQILPFVSIHERMLILHLYALIMQISSFSCLLFLFAIYLFYNVLSI